MIYPDSYRDECLNDLSVVEKKAAPLREKKIRANYWSLAKKQAAPLFPQKNPCKPL